VNHGGGDAEIVGVSSAKTALAESIRRRWRAMPITAAVPANLMPKASATARPARSSISSHHLLGHQHLAE
jgi:hypothetical protein